jgi:hypothetical protein
MSAPRFALLVLARASICTRHTADIYMRSGIVSTPIARSRIGSTLHKTRSFVSSSIARAAPSAPTHVPKSTVLISSSPTLDELKAQELDFDIIPEEDVKLELTNRAAEVCYVLLVNSLCLLNCNGTEAIEIYSYAGALLQCRPTHCSGVGRMSRLPVYNGACF